MSETLTLARGWAGPRRRSILLLVLALVLGPGAVATGAAEAAPGSGTTEPGAFEPVEPCRLLDTRLDRRMSAGSTVDIDVAGRCGVHSDAIVAAVTITAVDPSGDGFLTAFPSGVSRPGTSVVNYRRSDVVANHQFVRIGSDGALSLYTLAATDAIVDITGFFTPVEDGVSRAGRYVPLTTRRLVDTRDSGRPAAGSTVRVDPGLDDDVIAVAVNITTADTFAPGHFTAYPAGASRPMTSVLNVDRQRQVRAASAVVPVSSSGFDVYTAAANHVIVDILGYFTGSSAGVSNEGLYVGIDPTRLVDTRSGAGSQGGPRLWDHGTREFSVADIAPGAAAVAANVTLTDTEDAGHVVAYPARTTMPSTSSVNSDRAQQTIANFGIVRASTRGIAVHAVEATHLVIDIGGWFLGDAVATTSGAPRNDPPPDRRVTIIGDSAMAGLRWNGAYGGLQGFDAVPILESCRRLVGSSCRGREGYAPRTARSHVASLPAAGPEEILVIATGYNDWHEGFSTAFDLVIDAARERGFRHIVWIDYRSDVGYRLPGSGGTRSNYGEMNRVIGEKLASGAFPEVRRWSLDAYSAGTSGWFTYDGVHQTLLGSFGVADWISRHVRAFDDRPCAQPWTVGGSVEDPCPDPDDVVGGRGVPDIASLYAAELG
ncbi:hypothetical protein [Ilumatobacter sp.]|uniref:hypothetical protein n=1 Tax=Ilumatobacter sp. TaxID=1967498 RepID=UPI003AF70874